MRLIKFLIIMSILALSAGCSDESEHAASEVVRGLKTITVKAQQDQTIRRFPSVLQAAEVTTLSFENPGRLGPVNLNVGQIVKQGDVIASLDPSALEIQLDSAKAATEQALANAKNAAATFERLETLLTSGTVTRASVDDARAQMQSTQAQLEQAQKAQETAQDNLTKTELRAPFDGIVNSVEVESFANVSVGTPIATFYAEGEFEASFSVNYITSQQLVVGKPVQVRLADNPNIVLNGIVSELGLRADTVSSFPIVVKLMETAPELKAGMAIEVAIEFPVPTGDGYLVPLTVMPFTGQFDEDAGPNNPSQTTVFIFDEGSSSVKKRTVTIGGVRENQLIVISGLKEGERVASAGVSYLRDGQKVGLILDQE